MLSLLIFSGVTLTISLSGFLILGMQREAETKRFDARVARVSTPQATLRADARRSLREFAEGRAAILARLFAVLGIDVRRSPDYPIPWWVVLLVALVLARVITIVGTLLTGIGLLLAVPVVFLVLSRLAFGSIHARRSLKLFVQFPDALATIVRCVRVGIPVAEALRIIARDMPAPTAVEFGRLADKIAIGVTIDEALSDLATRNALPEYRFFATSLSLQARTGGALAQTLETLAEVIRKRVQTRARAHALAAEARSSAIVLTILPILTALIIWVLQPAYIAELFRTVPGRHLLTLAIILLSLGIGIMKTIIRASLA